MEPSYKTLAAYQKAKELSKAVFLLSMKFPPEEKFSLTDQIRRSSRSVRVNIGEAYRQRKYPKSFSNKLTIADGESTETQIWLECAVECGYVTELEIKPIADLADETGRLIGFMINNPGKFGATT